MVYAPRLEPFGYRPLSECVRLAVVAVAEAAFAKRLSTA